MLERIERKIVRDANLLQRHELWYLANNNNKEEWDILNFSNGYLYPSLNNFKLFLKKSDIVYIRAIGESENIAFFQAGSAIRLWAYPANFRLLDKAEAHKQASSFTALNYNDWAIPRLAQLRRLILSLPAGSKGPKVWHCGKSSYDVQVDRLISTEEDSALVLCSDKWLNNPFIEILFEIIKNKIYLINMQGEVFSPNLISSNSSEIINYLVQEGLVLVQARGEKNSIDFSQNAFEKLDYDPCRLPLIQQNVLRDPHQGLWELFGSDAEKLKQMGYVARNPMLDVQPYAIAIDFGTSSTVVASDTESGARELLRIGVRDFFEAPQPQHFENPTVLECIDFDAFRRIWKSQTYRPSLNWDWMRCAHEAQAKLRENLGDTRVLASVLPRLKQWALRSNEHTQVRLCDLKGLEIEIPTYSERNPVLGQRLSVSEADPFDPIELYAWYLGMAINYRGRGIFLKYYLSFPVKYESEVKARILASFRRGLQRSLPGTLVKYFPEMLNDFIVEELASEPAAYAAAALGHFDIELTDIGIAYAVFDLGGGTADFDYGVLRWANDEEEARGYERVFENLSSAGDKYLGGENLLEHLVYETFKRNICDLRDSKVQFTKPIDAQNFPGSEIFIAQTQAAQTNSVMLAGRLRNFMEAENDELAPQIKLDLLNVDGKKETIELLLDAQLLSDYLSSRIRRGVEAFLSELLRVVPEYPAGAPVHILLAGNGSSSRYVKTLFDPKGEQWGAMVQAILGDKAPEFQLYLPLSMDDENPFALTCKTGVALGLLQVAPGESVLLINRVHDANDGQAPFAWYVGNRRRGKFNPVLAPEVAYNEWHEVASALPDGVFNMYLSQSPRVLTGLRDGDPELIKAPLNFSAASANDKLYARAIKPNEIQLATGQSAESINAESIITRVLT